MWVPTEDALDAVTAVSGSGPAYFFLLAECMAEAGRELGLEHATAQAPCARHAARGGPAGARAAADLVQLRAEVTSRGGARRPRCGCLKVRTCAA